MNAPPEIPPVALSVALPAPADAAGDAGPRRDAAGARQATNRLLVLRAPSVANGQLAAAAAHESLA